MVGRQNKKKGVKSNLRTVTKKGQESHIILDIDRWALLNVYGFDVTRADAEALTVTYERVDESTMKDGEHEKFVTAFKSLINAGLFGPLVGIHSDHNYNMHSQDGLLGLNRFLPWHRVYLHIFENALQKFDPDVTIPYWDWTKNRQFPHWLEDFKPHVMAPDFSRDGRDRPIDVVRIIGRAGRLATEGEITALYDVHDYNRFASQLSHHHDMVHAWVNGTMGSIPTAPADPVFWLHHANIDRIWNIWQNKPGNAGLNPPLVGDEAVMNPWNNFTEVDTRDTKNFHYVYK